MDGALVHGQSVIEADFVIVQAQVFAALRGGLHLFGQLDQFVDDLLSGDGSVGGALAAAFGVGRQCLLQLIGQSEVIDDQSALLVADATAHSGDGNAGKPSSFRNTLCFPVADLIASSIPTNLP